MTGIERLRQMASIWTWDCKVLVEQKVLTDIADQIEREHNVSDREEHDAAVWVRDHGGLDSVKKLLDWVIGHCSTKQQLDFDFWLSGRVMHELGFEEDMADRDEVERRLLARLMPEGMEWPRYDTGEPVRFGDVVSDVEVRSVVFRDDGILLSDCTSVPGWGTWRSYKEPIKRPSKVLDAEGTEIRVGDTVYEVDTGEKMWVCALPEQGAYQCVKLRLANGMSTALDPYRLTHRTPVLAADGKPLRVGETVWKKDGTKLTVMRLVTSAKGLVGCSDGTEVFGEPVIFNFVPSELYHQRPDSWERIEEDAEKDPCDYFGFDGEETCGKCPASGKNCEQTMARDLVRRCKEFARKENNNE